MDGEATRAEIPLHLEAEAHSPGLRTQHALTHNPMRLFGGIKMTWCFPSVSSHPSRRPIIAYSTMINSTSIRDVVWHLTGRLQFVKLDSLTLCVFLMLWREILHLATSSLVSSSAVSIKTSTLSCCRVACCAGGSCDSREQSAMGLENVNKSTASHCSDEARLKA